MRNIMSTLLVFSILLLTATSATAGFTEQGSGPKPQQGDVLADFTLPAPANDEQAAYLGVAAGKEFSLSSIPASAILIEIFSMYCPHCQKEAPVVNELFKKFKTAPQAGGFRMLGIGTGNSEYEVGVFRDKFSVKMPLFPDGDYSIYNNIGTVGTPFFILARKHADSGKLEILEVHEGTLPDPQAFYTDVLELVQKPSSK